MEEGGREGGRECVREGRGGEGRGGEGRGGEGKGGEGERKFSDYSRCWYQCGGGWSPEDGMEGTVGTYCGHNRGLT